MPELKSNSERLFNPSRNFWFSVVPAIVVVLAASTSWWVDKLNSRPVLRIGIPDSQTSRRLRTSLEEKKWNPDKHMKTELEIVPLEYDSLFNAVSEPKTPPLDVIMIDDPWLAQLAEQGRIEPVPPDRFIKKTATGTEDLRMAFAPEFLRVSFYRMTTDDLKTRHPELTGLVKSGSTRRPQLTDLVKSDSTSHVDAEGLREVGQAYTLYSLPYVGNVQVMVRHVPSSGNDPYRDTLAARQADWSTIDSMDSHDVRFYTRLGSNNSALVDYLPILWSEGGCLLGSDGKKEVSALGNDPAVKALKRSLTLVNGQVQYARFNDEDVYSYLLNKPDSIGISWIAFRGRQAPPAMMWYLMPLQAKGIQHSALCANNEESANDGTKPRTGALGAWSLAVDSKSSQKARAWDFISWALEDLRTVNPPPQNCPDPGALDPVGHDPLEGYPTPFEDQLSCGARTSVRNSRPREAHPKWHEIEQAVGFRIRQAHWRTKSPEDAIESANLDIQRILSGK